MNKPLLSIIIPTFRCENTLEKLITSLENQKFKNYEIIIINDIIPNEEHTVLTSNLIKKLEKKYKNIVRYDMPHTYYQGEARNIGIEMAKGEFITFADSDDSYEPDFFETVIPYLKKNDFELLVFNANKMNYDKHIGYIIDKESKEYFVENNGFKQLLHGDFAHRIGVVPWNKIYLKKYIMANNIRFEEKKKSSEDFLFNLEYITPITKYRFVNKALYNYQLNMDVLKSKDYREYVHDEYIRFNNSVKRIAKKYNIEEYNRYLGLFILRRFLSIVLNETNNKDKNKAKNNIYMYIGEKTSKEALKKIHILDLDFKLFICYIIYKMRLYKIVFNILWKKRNKNS